MGEILRVPEVAKALGVSPQFVRRQIKTGNWKFGEMIKGQERDTYIIHRRKFERWQDEQN